MEAVLTFVPVFALSTVGLLVLMGKLDVLLANYRLAVKERRPVLVKRKEYMKSARPWFALIFFLLAAMILLEYLLRPVPEYFAFVPVVLFLPLVLLLEFKYRKRD